MVYVTIYSIHTDPMGKYPKSSLNLLMEEAYHHFMVVNIDTFDLRRMTGYRDIGISQLLGDPGPTTTPMKHLEISRNPWVFSKGMNVTSLGDH